MMIPQGCRAATRHYCQVPHGNRPAIIPEHRRDARPAVACLRAKIAALPLEPLRARRDSAPRLALAAAPPVRLPCPARCAAQCLAARCAAARAVWSTRDDRHPDRSDRTQRSPSRQAQTRPATARRPIAAAARTVQAVPVDRAVLPAQPGRHPELGTASAAAPGRAGGSAPTALLVGHCRRTTGRPPPEPRTAPARRPENPGPAPPRRCPCTAEQTAAEQGQI